MNRTNRILVAALALQIVLVAVVFWPRPAASVASGESLFADLEADQIVRLTISDGGSNQIVLAKGAEGWVVPDADDYPTQGNKVPDFVDKLVALKADRLVTETEGSHKRLKVAEGSFNRLVEFELADGTVHELYLGTSPTYKVTHVRADDEKEVYLVSDLSTSDVGAQATSWVDGIYYSVVQDDIVAITLENAHGRLAFEKDDAGAWTLRDLAPDETLLENNVMSLATRAALLRMQRPLGKTEKEEYGLKEPNAVVTVKTRDGDGNEETVTLRVGAQSEEDSSYVVISSGSPYYVRVADYTVRDYVEKSRDDYLQPPETPTPEPTS